MIYDRGPLTVYSRVGAPIDGRIIFHSVHYYAELTVYHRRFWESVQAGDRVDRLVQLPFGDDLTADLFAVPEDGLVYRINQAQPGEDDNGLPCCTLSLHREERNYEIIRAGADPEAGVP